MSEVDPRRRVPRTDDLLADPLLAAACGRLGTARVKQAVRAVQQQIRDGDLDPAAAGAAVVAALPDHAGSLTPVLNATGVVLHTNLGRAPLSSAAAQAVGAAAGYVDVEYDLASGARAARGSQALAALRAGVPAAQDVAAVNNGAAALLLACTALAAGREVIVSRGELVEIGDGFRLPALIESAGARIREVGTTNRTHLADYAAAVGPQTGCVLKVHPSNFVMSGFTAAVPVSQLRGLGAPVVYDIGSGLLVADPLLPDEPDVDSALRAGADLVTASGDKLLGGPQAGLLFGASALIEACRRHPMARALRVDKLTLAALEATVAGPPTPTWGSLHADPRVLRERCDRLAAALAPPLTVEVVPSAGAVGGGAAPQVALAGWALALPQRYAAALRRGSPAVVGRIERGMVLLDLRCVSPHDDRRLADAIRAVGC